MTAFTSKADFYEGSPVFGGGGEVPAGTWSNLVAGSPAVFTPPGRPNPTTQLYNDPVYGNDGTAMEGTPKWPAYQFVEIGPATGRPQFWNRWSGTSWGSLPNWLTLAELNLYTWEGMGPPAAAWTANMYLPYNSSSRAWATWNGTAWVDRAEPTWPT